MPEVESIIFSLENNKNLYYNMENNIRKKKVKLSPLERNKNRLESKVNKIKNSVDKSLGETILKLYDSRKVSQFQGAEKIIDALKTTVTVDLYKRVILAMSLNVIKLSIKTCTRF